MKDSYMSHIPGALYNSKHHPHYCKRALHFVVASPLENFAVTVGFPYYIGIDFGTRECKCNDILEPRLYDIGSAISFVIRV